MIKTALIIDNQLIIDLPSEQFEQLKTDAITINNDYEFYKLLSIYTFLYYSKNYSIDLDVNSLKYKYEKYLIEHLKKYKCLPFSVNDINTKLISENIAIQLLNINFHRYRFQVPYETKKVKIAALKQFDFIKNPNCLSKDDCVKLMDYNSKTFFLIDDGSDELYLHLIENCKYVRCLIDDYIKNPSEAVIFAAIKRKVYFGKTLFEKLSFENQVRSLSYVGSYIEYIKDPTEEMAKIALETYPKAIQYIKAQTNRSI